MFNVSLKLQNLENLSKKGFLHNVLEVLHNNFSPR